MDITVVLLTFPSPQEAGSEGVGTGPRRLPLTLGPCSLHTGPTLGSRPCGAPCPLPTFGSRPPCHRADSQSLESLGCQVSGQRRGQGHWGANGPMDQVSFWAGSWRKPRSQVTPPLWYLPEPRLGRAGLCSLLRMGPGGWGVRVLGRAYA